ncbi:MAG: DUF58 domain-containing protein [Gammaproteobacteria bacterium]
MSAAALLTDEELERLRQQTLEHWQREIRRSALPQAGPFPSLLRGQGLEIHDRRPYQPGDDVRHLDWRATARSNHPLSKVFLEERGRSLFLLIDRRPSLRFGSHQEAKAACAARIAAILAFTALSSGERVGGMVLEEAPHLYPAAGTGDQIFPLLQAAATPFTDQESPPPSLLPLWPEIARHCSAGTDLCLISDFHDLDDFPPATLRALNGNCAIHAFQVKDRGEASLPDIGLLRLRTPAGGTVVVDSADAALRRRYARRMAQQQGELARILASAAIPLCMVYNHLDTFRQLTLTLHYEGGHDTSP